LTRMSNAGIPLRIIQEISGHRNLEQLQKYLEVEQSQVRGAIASLSMLTPVESPKIGKYDYHEPEPELPSVRLIQSSENLKSPVVDTD